MKLSLDNLLGLVPNSKQANKTPSLDLYFQLMKANIDNQESHLTSLDTKANNIMTVATSILGAGLALQAVILTLETGSSSKPTPTDVILQIVALIIFLTAYAVTMYFSYSGYKLRGWKRAFVPITLPDTDNVVDVYQHMVEAYQKTEDENKAAMTAEMLEAYYDNKETNDKKAASIHIANICLGIETSIFGLFLVLQVLSAFRLF
jgi:hypothetical protein